ncbi:MAG TPA: TonB family protein [Pyrinomonadaceae bacterium]|jgi:protein TonB|nr:TonB family protein [Pyrinomonadaceae bacterium]
MKLGVLCIAVLVFASLTYSQSGRRAKPNSSPVPAPVEEVQPAPKPEQPEPAPVTAEKNQDYRCTDDGSLARILEGPDANEKIISAKEADEPVQMTKKPSPDYTREARRNGIQGFVTLRVLLAADSKVSRVRVLKGLPAGLTENAIRTACKIQFRPATKDGQPVSTWVTVEFAFRLADSSIFRP